MMATMATTTRDSADAMARWGVQEAEKAGSMATTMAVLKTGS